MSNGFISVQWTSGVDTQSGVCGHSVLWDQYPNTEAPASISSESNVITRVLANGMSHYVHIRSLDCAGNASETIHIGPFYVTGMNPGDFYQDNRIDLKDTILALQIISDMVPDYAKINLGGDVDGDHQISLVDGIYTVMCVVQQMLINKQ